MTRALPVVIASVLVVAGLLYTRGDTAAGFAKPSEIEFLQSLIAPSDAEVAAARIDVDVLRAQYAESRAVWESAFALPTEREVRARLARLHRDVTSAAWLRASRGDDPAMRTCLDVDRVAPPWPSRSFHAASLWHRYADFAVIALNLASTERCERWLRGRELSGGEQVVVALREGRFADARRAFATGDRNPSTDAWIDALESLRDDHVVWDFDIALLDLTWRAYDHATTDAQRGRLLLLAIEFSGAMWWDEDTQSLAAHRSLAVAAARCLARSTDREARARALVEVAHSGPSTESRAVYLAIQAHLAAAYRGTEPWEWSVYVTACEERERGNARRAIVMLRESLDGKPPYPRTLVAFDETEHYGARELAHAYEDVAEFDHAIEWYGRALNDYPCSADCGGTATQVDDELRADIDRLALLTDR